MTGVIERRLAELGLVLPAPAVPVANYVPYTVADGVVFVSGQLPVVDGALAYRGHVGRDYSVEEGYAAAKAAALNAVAHLKTAAGGDLDRVEAILRVVGLVASPPEFGDHPKVVNGASDLFAALFGEAGRHARSAFGVASLPLGAPVEIEITAKIRR